MINRTVLTDSFFSTYVYTAFILLWFKFCLVFIIYKTSIVPWTKIVICLKFWDFVDWCSDEMFFILSFFLLNILKYFKTFIHKDCFLIVEILQVFFFLKVFKTLRFFS